MNQNYTANQGVGPSAPSQQGPPNKPQQIPSQKQRNMKKIVLYVLPILLFIIILIGINFKYNYIPFNLTSYYESDSVQEQVSELGVQDDLYFFIKLNIVEDGEDDLSLISYDRKTDSIKDILNKKVPFYYTDVESPPLLSPNREYLYVKSLGIVDLNKKKIVSKPAGSCA